MKLKSITLGTVETNTYLMIDEATGEAALFDCPCESEELEKFIRDPDVKELKYIILTHGHFDHILGVARIRELTGAQVLIHEKDAYCLSDPVYSLAEYHHLELKCVKPDRVLRDGECIALGGLEIRVLYTPGHTVGSCTFLVGDTMISGDTLFRRTVGRCDLPTSDFNQMLESVRRLNALEGDYKVYPGHGRTTTLDDERAHNQYFKQALETE